MPKARKVVVLAGKIVGAALLFLAALTPVQVWFLAALFGQPRGDERLDGLATVTVLGLISLPLWLVCRRRKALLWVVLPLFTGSLGSLGFWLLLFWLVGQLGD